MLLLDDLCTDGKALYKGKANMQLCNLWFQNVLLEKKLIEWHLVFFFFFF